MDAITPHVEPDVLVREQQASSLTAEDAEDTQDTWKARGFPLCPQW